MKISTIMVCYNSEKTIGSAIESFLDQKYVDKELIIIDGNSSDKTQSIIQSFSCPEIVIFSEPDDGIYDAMNKGLERFSGDAFGFLNSDDRYNHENVLGEIASSLEQADIVSGHLRYVQDHKTPKTRRVWHSKPFKKGAFKRSWIVPHPATYATRKVYELTGKFDTFYRIAGDYDWILRALEIHDCRHSIIDDVIIDMKLGGVSTSGLRALFTNSLEPLRARQRWLGAGYVDLALLSNISKKIGQLRPFGISRI